MPNINRLFVTRDLFEELLPPKPILGRPVKVFTPTETLMVRQMLVAGIYLSAICQVMKVSEPTLRKYFKDSPHWNKANGPHRTMRMRALRTENRHAKGSKDAGSTD